MAVTGVNEDERGQGWENQSLHHMVAPYENPQEEFQP